MSSETGRRIVFPAVGEVAIEEFAVPEPGPKEIVVRARHSLISAGTELTNLTDALGIAEYPLYPGYSHVGVVESAGARGLGLGVAEAGGGVVVDQACGLHEGVADGGSDEVEAVGFEGFAHGAGQIGLGWEVV